MLAVKKILCPVDYSETSRYACQYALMMARQFGAELMVLHVIEATPLVQSYTGVPDMELPREVERAARQEMEKLLASQDRSGARVSSDIVKGPSYRTIVEYSKEYGADLIVIGTHGRSKFEYAFFGSVAERVTKSAACPVLVVRRPKGADAGGKKKKGSAS